MINEENEKKGISLIVLVITIIVIIILAGSVILSLSNNNPITQATEASYKASVDAYNSELNMTLSNMYVTDFAFKPSTLYAGPWDGSATTAGTVKQYISSMTTQDGKNYAIQQGKLTYIGTETEKVTWTKNIGVQESKLSDYIVSEGVNKPVLAAGMTPVKWNGSAWVNTTEADSSWYNYVAQGAGVDGTSQWANAITADGSMWVWIPRYVYKISSGWHSSTTGTINIQFSKGTNDYWNSSVIGALNLATGASASNGTWTSHPAFSFGDTELTGIWVAKFEASNSSGKVKVSPNVIPWLGMNVNDMFNACRTMENDSVYGWANGNGIDTHMMKNIEWGAVAYLSHSNYGRNGNAVDMNLDASFYTGGNGYVANVTQSTTGNVYGVYDMSAGSWEHTAAYVNNGNSNLTVYGANLVNSSAKYKDEYSTTSDGYTNNYNSTLNKKGDAVYETSADGNLSQTSWFSDWSHMPHSTGAFFTRGGYYGSGTGAGTFSISYNGSATAPYGFRPVLSVSNGL